jgi:hypothetical protein
MLGSRAFTLATCTGSKLLSDSLTAHLRARLAIQDQQQLDMAVAFLVNGLRGLLTWWLDTQPGLPADEVYSCFERLAAQESKPCHSTRTDPSQPRVTPRRIGHHHEPGVPSATVLP